MAKPWLTRLLLGLAAVAAALCLASVLLPAGPYASISLMRRLAGQPGYAADPNNPSSSLVAELHGLESLHSRGRLLIVAEPAQGVCGVLAEPLAFNALLVVTANRQGLPPRRADAQPFVSLATKTDPRAPHSSWTACTPTTTAGGQAAQADPTSLHHGLQAMSASAGSTTQQLPTIVGDGNDGDTGGGAGAGGERTDDDDIAGLLPLGPINSAALALEPWLGRRLFPITIATFERPHAGGPYAIFDASSGLLLLDRHLVASTFGLPEVQYLFGSLGKGLLMQVANMLAGLKQQQQQAASTAGADAGDTLLSHIAAATTATAGAAAGAAGLALHLLSSALAVALPAAFAAAPPLWFCILCPAALGLIAPVAINLVLNQAAAVICKQMQLPDEQCFDLLIGALALGFVLSLASAVPIFLVCRMQQCAHRNGTSGVGVGAGSAAQGRWMWRRAAAVRL